MEAPNFPFQDYFISSAVYYRRYHGGTYGTVENFLLFGSTKQMNLGTPISSSKVFDHYHGFIYPFNSKEAFKTCLDEYAFTTSEGNFGDNGGGFTWVHAVTISNFPAT